MDSIHPDGEPPTPKNFSGQPDLNKDPSSCLPGKQSDLEEVGTSSKPTRGKQDVEELATPIFTEFLPLLNGVKAIKKNPTPSKQLPSSPAFLPESLNQISIKLGEVLSSATSAESLIGKIEELYSRIVIMNTEIAKISTAQQADESNPQIWTEFTWASRKCSSVQKGVAPVIFAAHQAHGLTAASKRGSIDDSSKGKHKDSNLSLTDLHRLFGQRPVLSSSDLHLLDPITRNAIRRENIMVAKAAGLDFSSDLTNSIGDERSVSKISDRVWLYLFETGVMAETASIAVAYLSEILTGTLAIQKQIYGERTSGNISALFNLLNLHRGGDSGIGAEDLDIDLIDTIEKRMEVQLEIVYHSVVMLNDIAFEAINPDHQKKKEYIPKFVFSNSKLIPTIVKGLIGVLSADVIKAAFKDDKSTKLVNRILQTLLSLESDQTLLGFHWLEYLPPIQRVRHAENPTKMNMIKIAKELNRILKELCHGSFSTLPIDYAGLPNSDMIKSSKFKCMEFHVTTILEHLRLTGISAKTRRTTDVRSETLQGAGFTGAFEQPKIDRCFWFAVLDFPTYLMWMGFLLLGAANKAKARDYCHEILYVISDYCYQSPVVQGQFFKQQNFEIFKALNRACDFELLEPLERIFSAQSFVVISKSPEFFKNLVEFLSPPIDNAWAHSNSATSSDYQLVRSAVLSIEILRQILQAIGSQSKCRRSRLQLEICIQKLLYPKVDSIMYYFSKKGVDKHNNGHIRATLDQKGSSLQKDLKQDNMHQPSLHVPTLQLLCHRLTGSAEPAGNSLVPREGSHNLQQPPAMNPLHTKRTVSSTVTSNLYTAPVPDILLHSELCLHSLRLLNDAIRFSGGFFNLFPDSAKGEPPTGPFLNTNIPGTFLDVNQKWNHEDFEYLRYLPCGNVYLAEIQCYYSHHFLFNRQLEYIPDNLLRFQGSEEMPSQPHLRRDQSVMQNLSVTHHMTRQSSNNNGQDGVIQPSENRWTKILNKQAVPLHTYCRDRIAEICEMLSKTDLMLRDTSVHDGETRYRYCLRGPLKFLHRFLCGVLVRVSPVDYSQVGIQNLIKELKDNFDAIIKMVQLGDTNPPATEELLADYTFDEKANNTDDSPHGDKLPSKLSLGEKSSSKLNPTQQAVSKKNQIVLLKIVLLIEELFKWKGFELEIIEVRRETDFQLNNSDTSSLYSGINVCENLALSSWMKTIQHVHTQEGSKNLLKKQKRVNKQKHAMDGLEGETPEETILNDREFEQVFSSAQTVHHHGSQKWWEDISDSGSEEEPEEIPNLKQSKQPTRSPSKSVGSLAGPAFPQNKSVVSQPSLVNLESPYFKARRQMLHEKRISLSEESSFFSSVDIGSNVSDLAYWTNLIGWIHTVLHDKLSKPKYLITDLSLLFFDEDFISLLNILQNFTKQKKSVRKILFQFITAEAQHPRHRRDTISKAGDLDNKLKVLTIDQYLFNSMILLQHALKQAVFGTNLKLELEQFFITSKFISSLMENNCNDFKDRLIGFTLGAVPVELYPNSNEKDQDGKTSKKNPPVNALGMIYDGLVLNPEITEADICTEDRGDMIWYNIGCLNLMAECMSGPFEIAQDSLRAHTAQKTSHLRLLRVCSRINTNINSSFFDLQEALVEFLAAIYEGVHQNTKKDLNGADSAPANMFKIIAQHLENLWLYSDVVIKGESKVHKQLDMVKSSATDWRTNEHFTQFIKSMSHVTVEPKLLKKENPMLDELVDYHTVHPSFSSHPSISIARKIYDIMTYAETAETRRFMRFLQTKRQQMHELDTEDTKTKLLKAAKNMMSLEFLDAQNGPSRQNSSVGSGSGGELAVDVQIGMNQNDESSDHQKSQKKHIMLFKFLMEITGSVEVVVEKKHVRVQFPILPECKFINDEEVEQFIKRCSLEDPNTRLFELIDYVDEVLIDKQNDMKFYKIFPPLIYLTRRRTFKLMVLVIWMLSAAINIIWIISSDIVELDLPEEIYERIDTISILSSSAQLTIAILSVVIVVLSLLIFVIWLFTRWLNLVNIKELQLKKQKALNTEFQTRILRFKAFIIDSLIGQPLPMVLLMHILFVIFYYTITDFFVCLHLLLFVYHSETTRYIMKSVTKDLKKIGITFLMIIFMVYCYSTIIGYHYADQFNESFTDINPCQTWASCLVYSFDYGLRLGGGIGDAMNLLPKDNNYFMEKLIINLTFLLLIKLIASNIVLGIIIDTFSDLRDSQSARETLLENECFICGIEKNEFEKREKSFLQHVEGEHKILSYIHFMVYLKSKKSDQISGVELYVRELFVKQKSTMWYPIQSTVFLEGGEQSKEDFVKEKLTELLKSLGERYQNIHEEIKHLNTKFRGIVKEKKELNVYKDNDNSDEEETDGNQNNFLDATEKEAFLEFYNEFKERDTEQGRLATPDRSDDFDAIPQQKILSRRKRAIQVWKQKKDALFKDLEVLDTWKHKMYNKIEEERNQLSAQLTSAEVRNIDTSLTPDKKDTAGNLGTSKELLASIMKKVDILVKLQAN